MKKHKSNIADILQNGSGQASEADSLVLSSDPLHPANHICELCRNFYTFGWVTGTGGGVSIKNDEHIYIAPSGVQKELMKPTDIFVMDAESSAYLRRPAVGRRPSENLATRFPLFLLLSPSCTLHRRHWLTGSR